MVVTVTDTPHTRETFNPATRYTVTADTTGWVYYGSTPEEAIGKLVIDFLASTSESLVIARIDNRCR